MGSSVNSKSHQINPHFQISISGQLVQHPVQVQRPDGEGVQDLQGQPAQEVRDHAAPSLHHSLHKALHQEHLLRREEPDHRQLSHQVDRVRRPALTGAEGEIPGGRVVRPHGQRRPRRGAERRDLQVARFAPR